MLSGSRLCGRCGMCCDGTAHTEAVLQKDEVEPARAIGLTVISNDAGASLRMPCRAHREGCCSVYPDRPTACREYRCQVLRDYESGRIGFADAEEIVKRALRLRQAVVDELPPDQAPADLWRAIESDPRTVESPEARRTNGRRLLAFATLRRFLHEHFDPPE